MKNKEKLPRIPHVTYVNLEGKEMHTFGEYFKDQVNRLIPYYKFERGGNTKFALECIAEVYLKIDNEVAVNIGNEAQRRLDKKQYD